MNPTVLIVGSLWLFAYIATPVALVWGWIVWIKGPRAWTLCSRLSFFGFCFASLSALLAITSMGYAQIHTFQPNDQQLAKIFSWGFLLSLSAIVLSGAGVWKQNPVRWFALVAAVGSFMFWFAAASSSY